MNWIRYIFLPITIIVLLPNHIFLDRSKIHFYVAVVYYPDVLLGICFLRRCLSRTLFLENSSPHLSQSNGLMPKCTVDLCLFKSTRDICIERDI